MNAASFLAVFIGGGIGSICRFAVSLLVIRRGEEFLPLATLLANVCSCIVMAVVITYFSQRIPEGSWQRLFLMVGFCGGFSTFSTFSLENFQLMRAGQFGFLALNVLVSVLLCVMIFWLLVKRS